MRHSFVAAVMLRYVLLLVLALPALVLAAGMERTEAEALAARAAAALGGFTVAAHVVIAMCAWARRAKRRMAAKRPSAFAALMAASKTQIVQPGQKRSHKVMAPAEKAAKEAARAAKAQGTAEVKTEEEAEGGEDRPPTEANDKSKWKRGRDKWKAEWKVACKLSALRSLTRLLAGGHGQEWEAPALGVL